MEEWQNGHDQPGYHYHQEQDKKRKPIETPGKRFWKMWGPLLIKWGIGIGVGMVVMAAMMVASLLTGCGDDTAADTNTDADAGGIRSIDV